MHMEFRNEPLKLVKACNETRFLLRALRSPHAPGNLRSVQLKSIKFWALGSCHMACAACSTARAACAAGGPQGTAHHFGVRHATASLSFFVFSRSLNSICTTGITQARIMVFVPRALHIFSVLVAFSILGLGLPHGAFSSFRTRDPTSSCFPRDWGLICYSFALENVPAA